MRLGPQSLRFAPARSRLLPSERRVRLRRMFDAGLVTLICWALVVAAYLGSIWLAMQHNR